MTRPRIEEHERQSRYGGLTAAVSARESRHTCHSPSLRVLNQYVYMTARDEVISTTIQRLKPTMNTSQAQLNMHTPIFIGKWTPRILFLLRQRPHRHGELRRQLASVSQRMLTRTLRKLETAGLISKRVMQAKTVAVEYSLTKLGRTIITPLRGMCRWAKQHGRYVSAEVYVRNQALLGRASRSSSGIE